MKSNAPRPFVLSGVAVTVKVMTCLLITLVIPPFALITEKILSVFEQVILVAGKYLDLRWVIGSLNLSMVILIILLLFILETDIITNMIIK